MSVSNPVAHALASIRVAVRAVVWLLPIALVSGCDLFSDDTTDQGPAAADERSLTIVRWGEWRATDGNFVFPRAIDVWAPDADAPLSAQRVVVADKTRRIQIFDGEGRFLVAWRWQLPPDESDADGLRGFPVGVAFEPTRGPEEGLAGLRVWVASTHYSEVVRYDGTGRVLERVGDYGTEPGRFVYPARVEPAADGSLLVTEFGQRIDRVQFFEPPDADGRRALRWSVGGLGPAPGQFRRPNGCARGRDGACWIADGNNHRLVELDPQSGSPQRVTGSFGDAPGDLKRPFGLAFDGRFNRLIVAERLPSRLSVFSADGRFLGSVGPSEGLELSDPWDVTAGPRHVFIPDYRNHRVVRLPLSELPGADDHDANSSASSSATDSPTAPSRSRPTEPAREMLPEAG